MTSRKKRNTMLQFTNTSQTTGAPVPVSSTNPFTVAAQTGTQVCIFMPTAMDLTDSGGQNTIANQAERTATTCYIKGFSEKMRIQTSSQVPWFWRRIAFRARNSQFYSYSTSDTPGTTIGPSYIETSSGMQRLFLNLTINGANQTLANIYSVLFKGATGVDWSDAQTAAVDTRRVDLVSDRTWTIRSGNGGGAVKHLNQYYPYNHNLVYDDDENGVGETSRYWSVNDKQGNGDLFIFDIFTPGAGGTSADLLQLVSTSTLYWHEK